MRNNIRNLFLILFLGISTPSVGNTGVVDISILEQIEFTKSYQFVVLEVDETSFYKPKNRKLKAILLAVFLGHFGVHRIYLGTKENVPVVYSLTLGGGLGLLPLFDIIAILATKDLDRFANNNKVFMWSKPKQ